jgi:hypothetical protein
MRAPKSLTRTPSRRRKGDGRILLKRAESEDMAARILKFDLESCGWEISATDLFGVCMGMKAFKSYISCVGG